MLCTAQCPTGAYKKLYKVQHIHQRFVKIWSFRTRFHQPFLLRQLTVVSAEPTERQPSADKDRNRPVSRRSELRSRTALMDEQSNPYSLLQL